MMVLSREPLGRFCDVGCCWCFCFTSLELFHSLLFNVIPLPRAIFRINLVGIYQFCTLSLAHCRVICNTFMLTFLSFLLYRECYGFDLAFYRQPFFTLHSCLIFEALVTQMKAGISPQGCSCMSAFIAMHAFRSVHAWCFSYKTVVYKITLISHEI